MAAALPPPQASSTSDQRRREWAQQWIERIVKQWSAAESAELFIPIEVSGLPPREIGGEGSRRVFYQRVHGSNEAGLKHALNLIRGGSRPLEFHQEVPPQDLVLSELPADVLADVTRIAAYRNDASASWLTAAPFVVAAMSSTQSVAAWSIGAVALAVITVPFIEANIRRNNKTWISLSIQPSGCLSMEAEYLGLDVLANMFIVALTWLVSAEQSSIVFAAFLLLGDTIYEQQSPRAIRQLGAKVYEKLKPANSGSSSSLTIVLGRKLKGEKTRLDLLQEKAEEFAKAPFASQQRGLDSFVQAFTLPPAMLILQARPVYHLLMWVLQFFFRHVAKWCGGGRLGLLVDEVEVAFSIRILLSSLVLACTVALYIDPTANLG